jgi:hypothetical protein
VSVATITNSFLRCAVLALGCFGLERNTNAQGTAYCFGDGSGTACPCSNFGFPGGGCSNSSFPGAILSTQGTSSLANDTLVMHCSLLPFDPSGTAFLFQGATRAAGGAGTPFGAGLRCISGPTWRIGRKSLATGGVDFGSGVGDAPLSVTGGIAGPGTTMNYQIWYRDVLAGCSAGQFNLSNGVRVTWAP